MNEKPERQDSGFEHHSQDITMKNNNNTFSIKRFCTNCGYRFTQVKHDPYCSVCRSHHNQYLDYISMARGIGKRPVILPVSLKPYLYKAGNGHAVK